MISGKNIICFASGWDYHPTSKHHIMRGLAEHNNVVWVNWHASRRPRLGWTDLRTIGSKLREIRRGPQKASEAITVLTPCQLPFPGLQIACRLNTIMVRRAIQKVLATLPPNPIQLWSFAPDVADLVGTFDEELVVYYCVDAFGEFPGFNRTLIEQRERELIGKCDVVITTAPPLHEAKQKLHSNVHFVQHGVDHAHLSKAVNEDLPIPDDLRELPGPIFGFVGAIDKWVDVELVAGLAKRRPNASIVMIGPENTSRGSCVGLPNVHWLGPVDHKFLPNYLRYFDVGLIPFKKTLLTYNANPIKLYEYLAAGVPVVSTTLPAVKRMPGSVWVADGATKTAVCCTHALGYNNPAVRKERSDLMVPESWSARLDQLSEIISGTSEDRPITAPPEPVISTAELAAV